MQVAWLQPYEGRRGKQGQIQGVNVPAAESYLSKNMSLSSYVTTSFLFHSGLTDVQFHTLYTVACPMTGNCMVSYLRHCYSTV
jgi:hypothetical protein